MTWPLNEKIKTFENFSEMTSSDFSQLFDRFRIDHLFVDESQSLLRQNFRQINVSHQVVRRWRVEFIIHEWNLNWIGKKINIVYYNIFLNKLSCKNQRNNHLKIIS